MKTPIQAGNQMTDSKRVSWLSCTVAMILLLFLLIALHSQSPKSAIDSITSYYPLSVGNKWIYEVKEKGKVGKPVKWEATQKEILHGLPAYHIWEVPSEDDEPLSLSVKKDSIAEDGTERILLKFPMIQGDHWSGRIDGSVAKKALDSFTVVEIGKPCSVGLQKFDDCLLIREVDDSNNSASLTTYARGVGPVLLIYYKGTHSDQIDTILIIKSWIVK
jgi:hypothetical protein